MKVNSSSSYGKFTVSLLSERIIYAKLIGSFSERGISDYINQVKTIISDFAGKPFAMLINNLEISFLKIYLIISLYLNYFTLINSLKKIKISIK